ncbi:hypothetical protein J5N97_030251 [Dioscorea zingiberensis]|uniref:M-phase phosphoprotein 6 n=1 Tax=Dioscorea zingiberensis TaxID=325984 RepID=A0A9D5BXB5_9LILI|nr:hypothetical protein J5N97_030251 [Dioscorea zingiberensis]
MAKRELSSTLRNLKFMQRASLKESKPDEDEVKLKPDESFGSTPPPARRWCSDNGGDPHPGALKGRMSFQSFNPSNQLEHQNNIISERSNGPESVTMSENSKVGKPIKEPDVDLKRKQPETETPPPHNSQKGITRDDESQSSSQNQRKNSHKQNKREKLDWNVLRPPKVQSKRE